MKSNNDDNEFPIVTLETYALNTLRKLILDGEIKPGQRLDQDELSIKMRVSRNPIRNAIRALATEGIIDIYPHKGAFIRQLSSDEIEEIYSLRAVIEGFTSKLAMANITDEHISILISICDKLDQTNDPDEYLELNHLFHDTIYEQAKRRYFASVICNLRNILAPAIRQYVATENHLKLARLGHRRILNAVINKDPELVELETKKHLLEVFEGIKQLKDS
jgi:DNA-binding GntR family transcriptional regulator